jgi:plastocyanin
MLHHNVFTNGGPRNTRRDGACPDNAVRERFYGTSEELRPLTLPAGYGYPSSPRDKWKTIWMVMNHRHDLRKAYVEYRVTVDSRPGITPVKPYWLSVIPCVSDPQYTVPGGKPAGSFHVRSETFRMPVGGRIVAVGGHLHGGGRRLELTQPDCDDRMVAVSQPTYAPEGDPLYAVKPLLHEPDPKSIDWHQWADGWAIAKGTRLKVRSVYEGSRPHMRVMGIAHVYLAPDKAVAPGCNPAPTERETFGPDFEGREEPPLVNLTLAQMGRDGKARPIDRPAGRMVSRSGDAEVMVRRFKYRPPLLSVPRGARVRWDFDDRRAHDTTVVSGPRGFATKNGRKHVARYRFKVPGTYKLYCSVHPTTMSSVVKVR